ncbi:SCO4225 family membrane protein [Spirillospora sp. CA-294931]|uniref:SCO4225 family membrane protein n=1 Tax=Spirillospora sp. CA-294931 TaxID=3240042 RepID=UPI003D8AB2BB
MFSRLSVLAKRRRHGWLGIAVPGAYLALVLVTTGVVAAVHVFADDPGFIGVWLILVTSPLSMVPLMMVDGDLPGPLNVIFFYGATTGSGLVQAWLLWVLARGKK